ncbi:aminotransferase class I/II-fold pyridoxal phosphate-dependent enzyme [Nitratidesulfovibrio sp.]|uniref:aminotransferase class I/II-fold pyridoxal phosphate-dependent enzyme n=1 Tax=Nitratidesulfovibrio sp. TaxID=2802297 RepID=UPI0033425C30
MADQNRLTGTLLPGASPPTELGTAPGTAPGMPSPPAPPGLLAARLALRVEELHAAGLGRNAPLLDGLPGPVLASTPDSIPRIGAGQSPSPALVHMQGRPLLQFSGNDYLGLAAHEEWRATVADCFARHAPSGTASRLAAGHTALAAKAEAAWADYFGYAECLFLPSGYQANLALLWGLLGHGDAVFLDRRVHASMAHALPPTGARLHTHRHADMDDLSRRLAAWRDSSDNNSGGNDATQPVILAESLYSMDGTLPEMTRLGAVAREHGAFVIVDEAHAFGALGTGGRGRAHGVADAAVGTLGKALGLFGAFLLLPRGTRSALENLASPLIHSTALPEAHAACCLALLDLLPRLDGRRHHLAALGAALRAGLRAEGLPVREGAHVVCVDVGDEDRCTRLAARLRAPTDGGPGVLALAARHPTVGRGAAILRLGLTALHRVDDVARCVDLLARAWKQEREEEPAEAPASPHGEPS